MDSYLTWQTGVLMAALLAGVGASIPDRRRLALVWAALLPIDYLHGVSVTLLDALRYSGAIVLTLAFAPTLAAEARPRLRQIGAILLGLATIRGLAAVVHHDPNGRQFAVVLTLATLVAWAMALRPRLHLHLVVGYMAGLTLSVAVSIMQALHLPTLVEGNNSGQRYPGLATYTMLFTWQVAVGMVILGVVITTRITHRHLWWWMSVALFPFFAMAMVTNGAQGGLLGLFTAFVAFLRFGPVRLGSQAGRRWIMATLALVTLMVTAAFLTQIEIPTITDWGDGGYHNERARFDIVFDGLNEFRAHPLLGVSRTDFIYQYRIAPISCPSTLPRCPAWSGWRCQWVCWDGWAGRCCAAPPIGGREPSADTWCWWCSPPTPSPIPTVRSWCRGRCRCGSHWWLPAGTGHLLGSTPSPKTPSRSCTGGETADQFGRPPGAAGIGVHMMESPGLGPSLRPAIGACQHLCHRRLQASQVSAHRAGQQRRQIIEVVAPLLAIEVAVGDRENHRPPGEEEVDPHRGMIRDQHVGVGQQLIKGGAPGPQPTIGQAQQVGTILHVELFGQRMDLHHPEGAEPPHHGVHRLDVGPVELGGGAGVGALGRDGASDRPAIGGQPHHQRSVTGQLDQPGRSSTRGPDQHVVAGKPHHRHLLG